MKFTLKYYLPPRLLNLKYNLYVVFIGFSGLVQLHIKLSQLLDMQEKFVITNGLSLKKDQLFINTKTIKYLTQ